eukprot:s3739_g2.t1
MKEEEDKEEDEENEEDKEDDDDHDDDDYLLRLTFNDLLDFRAVHLGGDAPVAVGAPPPPPPPASRRREEGGCHGHRGEGELPGTSSHSPRGTRSPPQRSEPDKTEKKSKSKKEKKSKDLTSRSEPRSSRGSKRKALESVKAEESEEGKRSSQGHRDRHPPSSPVRKETGTRTTTREEEEDDRDQESEEPSEEASPDRGEREEEECSAEEEDRHRPTEPPPGRWVLSPRPETVRPRPGRERPPEPAGPPPGWRGPIYAGGSTRRPAAAEEPRRRRRGGEEEVEDALQKFNRGEKVVGVEIAPGGLDRGTWVLIDNGCYYKQEVQLAGKLLKEEFEAGERELHLELTGTKNEQLLQYASALSPAVIRVHLCRPDCPQSRENPDLVHTKELQKLPGDKEKTWETNLLQERETQLLQEDHERWRREEEAKKKKPKSSSSSRDKKKKKRKKKKEKREVKEGDREKGSPEKKKSRIGSRVHARKSLEACFANTGLDPDQKIRRRVAKRAKRVLKKNRDSSSTTTSSSSTEEASGEDANLLQDRSKVHRLAEVAPGVLTASSVANMGQYLTQVTATGWESEAVGVPPLLSLYNRVYMQGKLSGGMQREFLTLCHCGDLLLRGCVAQSLDTIVQRLKSLELVGQGTSWAMAQKLELVPPQEAGISTRQEHQLAKREVKLDMAVKGSSSASATEKGKGKGKTKTFDKGKEKGRGKAKEGDGKKPA